MKLQKNSVMFVSVTSILGFCYLFLFQHSPNLEIQEAKFRSTIHKESEALDRFIIKLNDYVRNQTMKLTELEKLTQKDNHLIEKIEDFKDFLDMKEKQINETISKWRTSRDYKAHDAPRDQNINSDSMKGL